MKIFKKCVLLVSIVLIVFGMCKTYLYRNYSHSTTSENNNMVEIQEEATSFSKNLQKDGVIFDITTDKMTNKTVVDEKTLSKIHNDKALASNENSNNDNSSDATISENSADNIIANKKPSTAYERIKTVATPSEFVTGARIISKIDVGYAQKLLSSNKSEFKKYLKSRLSDSEISQAIHLYSKYSYLLKD